MALFPLRATDDDVQSSEKITKVELEEANQQQDKQAEKRKKAQATRPRMVFPQELVREDQIIDPEGDLSDYKIIGEKVSEVLVMVPASFKVIELGTC